jgi:hypothetical protein
MLPCVMRVFWSVARTPLCVLHSADGEDCRRLRPVAYRTTADTRTVSGMHTSRQTPTFTVASIRPDRF